MRPLPDPHVSGISLTDLAAVTGGEVVGNPTVRIFGVCSAEEPQRGCITFTRSRKRALIERLLEHELSALIVPADAELPDREASFLLAERPLDALVDIIPLFFSESRARPTISPLAQVEPSAVIGSGVSIGPFSCIGRDCVIGDDVVIHPHVVIYDGAQIGPRTRIHSHVAIREDVVVGADVVIHNGSVIGADGFGYIPDTRGLKKVPQVGTVRIGDGVEIGANSCIDRATLGTTSVGNGVKVDNLVQVGHNVKIGQSTLLCAQVGIAGSVMIGDGVVMGGGSGVADHMQIVAGSRVAGHSGVITNISEPGDYAGFPAVPAAQWRRQEVSLAKLPDLLRKWLRKEREGRGQPE